ncbi:MAG: hypothetical protein HC882_01585 [Acidobacteria bacterium]|nr:hypothetical protein [Acidobacteriota bacterium]
MDRARDWCSGSQFGPDTIRAAQQRAAIRAHGKRAIGALANREHTALGEVFRHRDGFESRGSWCPPRDHTRERADPECALRTDVQRLHDLAGA